MQFYNTLSGKKEEFVPIEEGKVRMYACGPTVYNFFHVGNARCFVVFDMLRRYLEYRGYDVKFVQNFTDIDDKVIKRANEEGVSYSDIAKRYIDEYLVDAKGLGVRPASVHPLATDNIDMIIEIVSKLVENGYAYESNGDVYFRTRADKDYGKLSGILIEDLESGARIDVSEQKEDPLDFALWKAAKPGEPSWVSPWGQGRPGWHIECSAMNRRYLGDSIDIHCGGQDLIFPHHENEIAQTECCTGKKFCNYWLHNGYINIDNRKMSKSLNNFFTVREIAQQYGYLPIRHFILSSHYRSPINFSKDIIEQSKAALDRIFNCADNLKFFIDNAQDEELRIGEQALVDTFASSKSKMIEAMDDDFNTGGGVAALFDLVRDINQALSQKPAPSKAAMVCAKKLLDELTELFGFVRESGNDADFIAKIEKAIEERKEAKKNKDFAKADRIRNELLEMGVVLKDTSSGTMYQINK